MRRPADKAERLAARYIPKNAKLQPGPAGATIYTYEATNGALYALMFRGSSSKAERHYRYRSEAERVRDIAEFRASVAASLAFKAERRAERSAWTNPLKVGTILVSSWGYDQTNVDFYVVTAVSGKRVKIAPIAADYEATGHMSGKTWPAMPVRIVGAETTHTAQPSGTSATVKVGNHYASVETGREHYTSSYA